MSLATYLVQRGKRGTWQLRVPVPRALHAPGKPKERVKSMGTTDRRIASDRALRVLDDWKREWAMLRGELVPAASALPVARTVTPADHELDEAAVVLGYELPLSAADTGRRTLAGKGGNMYRAHVAFVRAELEEQVRAAATGDDALVRELAEEAMEALGVELDRDGEAYRKLVDRLNASRLANLQAQHRRNVGDLEAVGESPVIARVRQRERETAADGETILDLYDAFAAWRCQPGRKRRRRIELFQKDRVAVELFSEFVGAKRAVGSITKDDARAFRDMLAQFPASRGKLASIASASIADCIAIAKRDGLKIMSLTTQAKYLSIIAPLFDWLISDGPRHLALDSNVFDGLHPALDKGENRRPSFTTAQLNAIVGSPLFARCGGAGKEHEVGEVAVRDHRYWIPLLCLFTGSRVTEIAQLHVDDVAIKDAVPLIMLKHDEASGRRIKNKQSRIAALHDHLIAAGFLDYWREQLARSKHDGNQQLFPELKVRAHDPLGAAPGRWLGRYLTRIGVKDGADGFGMHSFRHTMSDAMRAAGFIDVEFGQLVLGHSNNTITSVYGNLPQGTPARLKAMVDAAFRAEPFKGVNFAHLMLPNA
ncbi:tyrosine-type recombinase/integrase [Sphingomonas jeddahensis]|uniref:Site-specific tyrosine recombinase XerD n=1 Tax=Sphingomonas jeddahensis TaxID=1915074 RepID=A0A1V2EUJ2_9SPHN|nr:tyrosine-type recombinase/integrase [Sphingomonas jeddahensis]ONF95978.1 site-specific tyrosine recombinase XerD [Sphingomonas jeddahensis]